MLNLVGNVKFTDVGEVSIVLPASEFIVGIVNFSYAVLVGFASLPSTCPLACSVASERG